MKQTKAPIEYWGSRWHLLYHMAYCNVDTFGSACSKDAYKQTMCHKHYVQYINDKPRGINERIRRMSTNLRQKVRAALRSKDERLLIETGFTYESGALTKEGRKVILDILFQDEALRSQAVELAKRLKEDDCKKKK